MDWNREKTLSMPKRMIETTSMSEISPTFDYTVIDPLWRGIVPILAQRTSQFMWKFNEISQYGRPPGSKSPPFWACTAYDWAGQFHKFEFTPAGSTLRRSNSYLMVRLLGTTTSLQGPSMLSPRKMTQPRKRRRLLLSSAGIFSIICGDET